MIFQFPFFVTKLIIYIFNIFTLYRGGVQDCESWIPPRRKMIHSRNQIAWYGSNLDFEINLMDTDIKYDEKPFPNNFEFFYIYSENSKNSKIPIFNIALI